MPEPREITDARTMRAYAHPTRLALLELIGREGEITATRAAEMLGESPGTMSWHLQTLAKYGFVEEAGSGKGRSRPWRVSSVRTSFDSTKADAGTKLAGDEMVRLMLERGRERQRQWFASRDSFGVGWERAAFVSESLVYLTADELDAIGEEITEIIARHSDRLEDRSKRPEGALPVSLTAYGHPLPPTESGN